MCTDNERVGLNWTWRVVSYSGKWPTLVKESSFVFLGIDDVCSGCWNVMVSRDLMMMMMISWTANVLCDYKLPNCGWDTVHGVEDH